MNTKTLLLTLWSLLFAAAAYALECSQNTEVIQTKTIISTKGDSVISIKWPREITLTALQLTSFKENSSEQFTNFTYTLGLNPLITKITMGNQWKGFDEIRFDDSNGSFCVFSSGDFGFLSRQFSGRTLAPAQKDDISVSAVIFAIIIPMFVTTLIWDAVLFVTAKAKATTTTTTTNNNKKSKD